MSVTHENSSNTTHRIGFDGEVVRAVSHFVAPPGAETVAAGSVLEGSIPYSLDGNKRIPLLWFAFCSGCSQTKDGSRFAPIFSGDRSGRVPDGVKEEAKIRLTQAGLPFRADFVDDAIFGTNENGAPKRLVQFPAGFTNAVYEVLELGDSGVPRRINLKTMRLSSLTGTQLVAQITPLLSRILFQHPLPSIRFLRFSEPP
jgi:hypothetical protein